VSIVVRSIRPVIYIPNLSVVRFPWKVIAHRLSTIRNADLIAVVDEGKIVETGTHEELLANKSHYFKLVEAQRSKSTSDSPDETVGSSKYETRRDSSVDVSVHDNLDDPAVIEFENVHFEYPTRPDAPVFRGLNLKVRQGETLALVGPSGCGCVASLYPYCNIRLFCPLAERLVLTLFPRLFVLHHSKSTVIQLMECFYRPTSGTIRYKDVDMKDLNVRWLRDQLGLVSQQPTLFDCSIEDNIRYSLPEASHEQVVEAAKQANAHSFIMEFPEGYATSVGQGSTLVSGGKFAVAFIVLLHSCSGIASKIGKFTIVLLCYAGQKQRISIARALVKKPKVLLLDEATSALDSASEKVVQEALDKIMLDKDQTCVLIAHRLSTIRSADRIAVLENGKVREIGTHDELMAKPDGRYRHLQSLQDLDMAAALNKKPSTAERKQKVGVKETLSGQKAKAVIDEDDELELDKKAVVANAKRARMMASGDSYYFIAGGIGASKLSKQQPTYVSVSSF
jgi:ATP-binding cassette subfamily B (MDR/TAP) protein 1